jgi:hypothetical protein
MDRNQARKFLDVLAAALTGYGRLGAEDPMDQLGY